MWPTMVKDPPRSSRGFDVGTWPRVACLVVLILAALFVDQFLFAVQSLYGHEVVVRGRFVDDETGQPLAGAWVMSLPDPARARDAEYVATWKERVLLHGPLLLFGGSHADEDGYVSFVVETQWCRREGGITGLSFERRTPPRFYGLGCVLVHAEGFGEVTVDPRQGVWSDDGPLLDFETIRLSLAR